jgi:hypothetical protein
MAAMTPRASGSGCAKIRQELGLYVLGAIEPAQRAHVDQHLETCLRCREELAGLAGLPGLLRRVTPGEAMGLSPEGGGLPAPGPPLAALLGRAARMRRHRRRQLIAAAAVLTAAIAVLGLQVLRPAAHPPAAAAWWAATAKGDNPATHAVATVRYANRPWGTALEVRVTGVAAGTSCQFWVTGARGQHIAAGGWNIAAGHQPTWYPMSVPLHITSLRGFEIIAGGQVLVAVPAADS